MKTDFFLSGRWWILGQIFEKSFSGYSLHRALLIGDDNCLADPLPTFTEIFQAFGQLLSSQLGIFYIIPGQKKIILLPKHCHFLLTLNPDSACHSLALMQAGNVDNQIVTRTVASVKLELVPLLLQKYQNNQALNWATAQKLCQELSLFLS